MDLQLNGKVALVTGSTSGIGFYIAKTLYNEGADVVINGRDQEKLYNSLQSMPGASGVVADVTSIHQCDKLIAEIIQKYDRLDILICNVGSGSSVIPGAETPDEWRRLMDINLYPAIQMVTSAKKSLKASSGNVVCISSICGLKTIGCPVAYAGAKSALESFVKNTAKPLGKCGIRINSLAPGNILFPGSVWDRKLSQDKRAVDEMLVREVALGRLGAPDDVSALVAYLASPLAAFITGATFVVDGGQIVS